MQPIIAAYFFQNEGLVAVLIAIIGTVGTLFGARLMAQRQIKREPIDDAFRFRGELSTDNQALRAEIRDLKVEIAGYKTSIRELEQELRRFYMARRLRRAERLVGDDAEDVLAAGTENDERRRF